jgi:hypothetical protein
VGFHLKVEGQKVVVYLEHGLEISFRIVKMLKTLTKTVKLTASLFLSHPSDEKEVRTHP